ncbi:glycosyltransferase [Rhizorhabdus dicambivorans]|uniref:Glycosyl transferase n=1 Tax=Rhizorhabdus dicambivorans TaxID=1850238 RepID=A0A2A4FN88_9SPHN|nr:glycosyltransferase [Rhizorhabdus dicambivorans]ATE64032.1 glycosyl transferase [Rhizorhabdus dicambivorans]PCE40225.1 glycosyl transferase [Rhizorhabdus dicambivorans]
MKAALVLHLFYPEVAVELIDRVAALGDRVDIFVTHSVALDESVVAALDRLPRKAEIVPVANRGWDIGPLFELLPLLATRGYDLIGKLHTKKGGSGYAPEWRRLAYDGMIADGALVDAIVAAFDATPDLSLLGAKPLYKSVASHLFRNAELLSDLAPLLVAPAYPPADWGFFAGTFFWARRTLLEKVAALADFHDASPNQDRDGALGHAVERLFGLAPLALGGRIGLVENGRIELIQAPGAPSHEPVIQTLVDVAGLGVGPVDDALAALIASHNPLIDYIRHGREADALDPNLYFSSSWYNSIHADVHAAGMLPLHHYIHHGAAEGRSTGPLFDGVFYRKSHDDVAGDPLRHYLEVGAVEGRVAIPVSRPRYETSDERPRRYYRHFDIASEEAFLRAMANVSADVRRKADETLISVIMPAWNRADRIAAAIRSVLAQSHAKFELLVVDDGSSDGTAEIAAAFASDPRVKVILGSHGGVSAARNLGLEAATGEIVAYLDSDNSWKSWFLDVMALFMVSEGLDCAYSGIALRDELNQLTGYRGDDFDWEACLAENYIDLNAFCHRRALTGELGLFDTNLRRMVDWDLILRYAKGRPVGYAPFVGCEYHDAKSDAGRITVSQPAAFQALVRTKNRTGLPTGRDAHELAAQLKLNVAIKIAAPEEEKAAWGDFHFAESLAAAIEKLGHKARIDFRGKWHGHSIASEDLVIVLRGLIGYEPRPGQMAFLWNISHPDQVGFDEMDRYSRVYAASASTAALVEHIVRPPVVPMLQATDPGRFHPLADPPAAPDIVFVGNSRGIDREIVNWAIQADRAPAIYGGGWDGRVPDGLIKATNVDNRELGALYAGAGVVLNDHWESMRAFGLLSNRLFDVVGAGGRAVSDPIPSMASVFGDAVRQVSGPAELRMAVDELLAAPRDRGAAQLAADYIHAEHSFDARARTFIADAFAILGLPSPVPAEAPDFDNRLAVHIIAKHSAIGPQSSAYIRLVAPLSDESVAGRLRLTLGAPGDPLPDCDVCIVQRTALPTIGAVDALVRQLGAMDAALVVDVDDAFTLIGPEHPEHDLYRPLNAALDRLVAAAAETWFSTEELARAYAPLAPRSVIVANAIDPRLWRDWRRQRPRPFSGSRVRMLYMGTHTHGPDFALIRPALDQLHAERGDAFDVTVIGIDPDIAPAPWLHRLALPAGAVSYPRFVRWLREQGPFDLGLAPLADNDFNRCKSDIKALDYAALGILPLLSDGPAYRADPVLGSEAFFSGPDDWLMMMREIIDNKEAAAARAAAVEAHVWDQRVVARNAPELVGRLEAYRR